MLAAWRGPRLLSLQGVINGIEPYQLGGLRFWKLLASMRPRQMLTAFALAANKTLRFNPRLLSERETLLLANHIMGRTPWDQAQAWAFNPQARYHHCSRTLRQPFYQFRWQPEAISRYTLFAGNAAVPLKGVHYLLEALALLRREFPEVRLIVAGEAPGTQASRFKRLVGYSAFLLDRIEQLGLQDCVTFTGLLDAEKMAAQMARCHAYVMGSLIENSPNTLAEAMLLGMPCAVGYAGGAPGMAQDEHEALFFRAGDPVTMAFQIKRLFNSDALCMQLSEAARARALKAHNPEANLQDLLRAYSVILENGAGDGG
jgi:glycosyltransferase involved in cell wall biosynthesis